MNATKRQIRQWAAEYPVGDPAGGPAFGEFNDLGTIFTVAAPIVGGLLAGDQQASATQQAAQTSAGASDRAIALQEKMFQQQQANMLPWLTAGKNALAQLEAGTAGPESAYMKPFTMADYQADPGYAFRLGEGMKALERSAAARGGLLSGATLKGIQSYGQGLASQEYQNAYNRYQQQQAERFNRLSGIAGTGQTAAGNLGQAGQQYAGQAVILGMTGASDVGNALLAGAQQRASTLGGIGQTLGGYFGGQKTAPTGTNYLANLIGPTPSQFRSSMDMLWG